MSHQCKLQFISDTKQVRTIVQRLLEFIDAYSPASEVRNDMKLVFSELLYNAVIHGNKEDRSKLVHVCLRVEADIGRIFACILDEGSGFDFHRAIDYAHSEAALTDEHGRGMVLVCALTENLQYEKQGSKVLFEKGLQNG